MDRASASTDGGRSPGSSTRVSVRLAAVPLPIDLVQLDPDLPLPAYAQHGDAGLDLYAREDATIAAGGGRVLMPTGISIAIPVGWCGLLMPRSGLALKHGIGIVNTPGLIDSRLPRRDQGRADQHRPDATITCHAATASPSS